MKCLVFIFLVIVVAVQCKHMFFGTNVQRPLVFNQHVEHGPIVFTKKVDNLYIEIPPLPYGVQRAIQGVMALDWTNSGASANVTTGGLGHNFVNIRMKSDRGAKMHYEIFIYA